MNAAGLRPVALDLGLQREAAGGRRAIGAGDERAEFGAGKPDAKPRHQAGGVIGNGEPAFEAALADLACDILEHDLRAARTAPCRAGPAPPAKE